MAYLTTTNIVDELPRLPQTETAAGWSGTTALISRHITKTEDRINGLLARRYSVPFSTVPPLIRTLAIDLVTYRTIRSLYSRDNRNRNEYLDDYLQANETLEEIRNGKIQLADSSGSLIVERASSDRIISNTEDDQPTFDLDTSTSWVVDPDYLDRVTAART